MDMLPVDVGEARVVLVTGGTDGIGRAVALHLARAGHRVLITGRNHERGSDVVRQMVRVAKPRAGTDQPFDFVPADLSSMADTAALADRVVEATDRLDGLVCCAGTFTVQPEWTAEGLERSFALNYLSRFLLVQRLLPSLRQSRSGRVVLVANAGRYRDTLDLTKLRQGIAPRGVRLAGGTQFANDVLTVELASRYRGTNLEMSCVNPGIVATNLFRHAPGLPPLLGRTLVRVAARIGKPPETAARTPAWLAADPEAIGVSGRFFGPHRAPIEVPDRARRSERRGEIWRFSEELLRPVTG